MVQRLRNMSGYTNGVAQDRRFKTPQTVLIAMSAKPIILVIERRPSEAESLITALRAEDYHTIQAASSEDALAYLELPVDLVLSNVGPADDDGRRLLESWKTRRPGTPFVLISNGNGIDAEAAAKLGATGCVTIPAHDTLGSNLVEQIKNWLPKTTENGVNLSEHLPAESDSHTGIKIPPGTTLEDLERVAVEQALQEHQGNRTHAAKSLGISVRTLQRKLKAWHGPFSSGGTAPSESRTNSTDPKMRPSNTWTGSQNFPRALNLRSPLAKVRT